MKKYLEMIKEFRKKPYGNAVLFFGFYFVFFLVIAIIFRLNDGEVTSKEDIDKKDSRVNVSKILDKDYEFSYEVILDNVSYKYVGEKKKNKISFSFNNINYSIVDGKFYMEKEEIENPIKFYEFFDNDNIKLLIDNSFYESQTTYESGRISHNLLLSSNTINSLVNKLETDIEEEPNKVVVSINLEDSIDINYNLSSYCTSNSSCLDNLVIKSSYNLLK